jgi:glycosyltransferase involved in cell wall biosynthesis
VNAVIKQELTVVVLTFNEQRHISRCLESVRNLAGRVVVVDSESTDRTCDIAAKLGADIYSNPFINQAVQLNWALDHVNVQTPWVMRLDADEVVTPALLNDLGRILPTVPKSVDGITVNRQIHFLGKWIRHGGIYPIRTLRIWRNGRGRCENRWMDEHIVVQGSIAHVDADIADINLNSITWWISKHNHYASREAIELLMSEMRADKGLGDQDRVMSRQARIKRWAKHRVYARLPLGLRALAYFLYRYIFRLGFLDGWPGIVFHSLQCLWYRFLVDVKVKELRDWMAERDRTLAEVVRTEYGYDITAKRK